MFSNQNTQLSSLQTYDVKNLICTPNEVKNIPNSVLTYRHINMYTRNPDGTVGDLIVNTERLFSFGVSENRGPDGKVNGLSMALCLWDRNGPTDAQKKWTDQFDCVVEELKEHLISHRDEIEKWDLDHSDLKKFNPIYWKKERNVIVPGTGPTLYAKLITSKRNGEEKIKTLFTDNETGEELNPYDLIGKFCYVTAAIKFDSIYIGSRISLRVKLWECNVSVIDHGMKRFLTPPPLKRPDEKFDAPTPQNTQSVEVLGDKDDLVDSDDSDSPIETVETVETPQPTKVSVKKRRVTKK
jgi:hypothetical protein